VSAEQGMLLTASLLLVEEPRSGCGLEAHMENTSEEQAGLSHVFGRRGTRGIQRLRRGAYERTGYSRLGLGSALRVCRL